MPPNRAQESVPNDGWGPPLFRVTLCAYLAWLSVMVVWGPSLPTNHDELNFLIEAMRLPAEGRLTSYPHGGVVYELIALGHVVAFVALRLFGTVHSTEDYPAYVLLHMPAFLMLSRAMVGLFGAGLLVALYRFGSLFGGKRVGALAAILAATNVTFVWFATNVKEDVPYWCFLFWALVVAWESVERQSMRRAVVAGTLIGLATATKYLGALSGLLCLLPLVRLDLVAPRQAVRLSLAMAAASAAAFLVGMPFFFTDPAGVLGTLRWMSEASATTGTAGPSLPAYLYPQLPYLIGWVPLVFGTGELVVRFWHQPRGPVLLVAVPVATLLFVGVTRVAFPYYIFTLALSLIVLSAARLVAWSEQLTSVPVRQFAVVALGVAVILAAGSGLPGAVRSTQLWFEPDTRIAAQRFLEAHAQPGSCVAITSTVTGDNVEGPPLVPVTPPEGEKIMARARASAFRQMPGPRYELRFFERYQYDSDRVGACDWFVAVDSGPQLVQHYGALRAAENLSPPAGFEKQFEIRSGSLPQGIGGLRQGGPRGSPHITIYRRTGT